jgi:hypothetical protein
VKTTLELPDELMREIRILAAQEGRKLKDIISESLRRDLRIGAADARPTIRDIAPVSVGRILPATDSQDRMEDMLDDRGHRY